VLFWALDRFSREGVLPTPTTFSGWTATASRGARTPSSTSTPPGSSRTPWFQSWRPSAGSKIPPPAPGLMLG